MTWARFDDRYPLHTKMLKAGPEALALDVAGICYANAERTDGFISDDDLPVVYPILKNPTAVARKLERIGRWERDENRGGWDIHDFLDYNPSASAQAERQAKRSAAGQRGGKASAKAKGSASAQAPANPVSRSSSLDSSSSSSTVLVPGWVDDDDVSLACWVLTQRKLRSEREAGRGPTTSEDGWLKATFLALKRTHEAASLPDESCTPEQLADWFEPKPAPKQPDPLDTTAAAARAREERHDNPCPDCRGNAILDNGSFCPACHPMARVENG